MRFSGMVVLTSAAGFALVAAGVFASQAAERPEAPFTGAQAKRGAAVFAEKCASCHGADLEGASASALVGPANLVRWAGQSGADIYARVRTMPYGAGGTLKDQQYLDLLALLLDRNGHKAGKQELGAAALPKIQMAAAGDPAAAGAAKAPTHKLTTLRDIKDKIGQGPTQADLTAAGAKTTDWLFANHDYTGQRFVDVKQITPGNVEKLRPVCLYQVGDLNPFEVNPLVYRGAMFITSRDSTVSIDAATCKVSWRYDRTSRVPISYGLKMNRGAAIKDGKLIYGTHDGFLIVLDAATGKLIWERDIAYAPKRGGGFTMPPMLFDDLVIIGPGGSEVGVKGWIGAFKLATGELAWKFNTVPEDGEPGADTWPNKQARENGGGAVWGSVTLDTATGRLYVPVSNPTPDWEDGTRAGNNLYTCSMIVLDVKTGKLIWHYQLTAHDTHDYDLTQASPLLTTNINGHSRDLIIAVGKEGVLHAFDRKAKELLYKADVTTRQNTDVPWITIDKTKNGERVCPGAIGGVQWNGPAYNPGTNTLYVNAVDWCSSTQDPTDKSRGWLSAIDASTGKMRWQYQSPRPLLAAITTTSADLVFTGEMTGDLMALNAKDGKVLYRFNTGGAMIGGIVTYDVGGKQYVAAASGGTNFFWKTPPGSATIVVLGLP